MTSRKSETLAYAFKPAGHGSPKHKREYSEPDKRLAKVFEEWLDGVPESIGDSGFEYDKAADSITDIDASVEDAHVLLLRYQDHPGFPNAGIFVSAVYNKVPDKCIVFDLELDASPRYLGYQLAENKIFVNRGVVGNSACRFSGATMINFGKAGNLMGDFFGRQTVINFGRAGSMMGGGSASLVVNCGDAGSHMGHLSEGIIIADKLPQEFGDVHNAKLVLLPAGCREIPELVSYLDGLRKVFECANNDLRNCGFSDLSVCGNPSKKIEGDITAILRRADYNV